MTTNLRPILKNKYYLYLTEFFAGVSVMAVELGASRLLAPYFSSSQIVWTIIIGTIMIAMALACKPRLLLADEPTTALDVTIQGQILALLGDLSRERGMGLLLITHDLGVVAEMADEVGVMYAGRIVERAPVRALFAEPRHPYTWGLIRSAPTLDTPPSAKLDAIPGTVPSPGDLPQGCPFRPRCPEAHERCFKTPPVIESAGADGAREVCCWLAEAR